MGQAYISEADIAQTMRDLGYDADTIAEFVHYGKKKKWREQAMLLNRQRQRLLDGIRADEKRIYYLDYFIYQLDHTEER